MHIKSKKQTRGNIDIHIFLVDEGMFQYCTPSVCFNLRKKSGQESSLVSDACESWHMQSDSVTEPRLRTILRLPFSLQMIVERWSTLGAQEKSQELNKKQWAGEERSLGWKWTEIQASPDMTGYHALQEQRDRDHIRLTIIPSACCSALLWSLGKNVKDINFTLTFK